VVAASKAGDPAWQVRAWFATETPTGDLPIGRSLRLVVDLRAADGSTIERIERSVRIGPIIEPDSRGSSGAALPRVIRSDPFTLGEDGVMGALTLDGIRAADSPGTRKRPVDPKVAGRRRVTGRVVPYR
jgi:hypothetical protein